MLAGFVLVEGFAIHSEERAAPVKFYTAPLCCAGKGCRPYNNVDKWCVLVMGAIRDAWD